MRNSRTSTDLPLYAVIATAGRSAMLGRTLDSLATCEKPSNYAGAWIVENGHAEGVQALVAKYDAACQFRYLHVPRPNKSNALNVLLAGCGNALLFFSDDDVRFDSQVLNAYAAAAAGVSRGRFFGGPLGVDYEGEPPPEWMRSVLPKAITGWQRDEAKTTALARPRFLGANWAAFAEDLRMIGGFDPRLGPGAPTGATGQETNSQLRLRKAGVVGYYVPDAHVWHHVAQRSVSHDWLVHRKLRHSREWGIVRAQSTSRPAIAIYARLRLVWARVARRFMSGKSTDPRTCLQMDCRVAKWQGRVEGLTLGRDWPELAPIIEQRLPQQDAG